MIMAQSKSVMQKTKKFALNTDFSVIRCCKLSARFFAVADFDSQDWQREKGRKTEIEDRVCVQWLDIL